MTPARPADRSDGTDPTDAAGPWRHRMVRANGVTLHVVEAGTGPLVLLLHGFAQLWWTWRTTLVDVADAGWHAVAVDLRGVGGSDKPPRGYDALTMADDVAGVVTALGERNAIVVVHDMGGVLAWTMAARHPRLVGAVVTVGSAHPLRLRQAVVTGRRDHHGLTQRRAAAPVLTTFQLPRRPERLLRDPRYVAALFDRWSGENWRTSLEYPGAVANYAAALQRPGAAHCTLEAFRWLVRSVPRPDGRRFATTVAKPVTTPVLQLHGEDDRCILAATAAGSGRYVNADYEWRPLPRVGHFPQDEVPELVSGEIIRWAKLCH